MVQSKSVSVLNVNKSYHNIFTPSLYRIPTCKGDNRKQLEQLEIKKSSFSCLHANVIRTTRYLQNNILSIPFVRNAS